jgi:hypothetical protein
MIKKYLFFISIFVTFLMSGVIFVHADNRFIPIIHDTYYLTATSLQKTCDGSDLVTYTAWYGNFDTGSSVAAGGSNTCNSFGDYQIVPLNVAGANGGLDGNYYMKFSSVKGVYYFTFTVSGNGSVAVINAMSVIDVSSNITASTTWDGSNVYKISGNLSINSGVTLNIESGAAVKFDTSTSSSLTVNGTLNAQGGSDGPVAFTSWKDDLFKGDTNQDLSSTSGALGDWAGITVSSGGNATFNQAVIRYGGKNSSPMIYNNGGDLTILYSTVAYGNTYGIKNSTGTTTVSGVDIAYNNYGAYFDGGSMNIDSNSVIHDNSLFGVYNNTTSTTTAENNYWGDLSGPHNSSSNPTGLGDEVSDYVDFYPFVYSNLHYVVNGCPSSTCASVRNNQILIDASTTVFASELSAATTTWNGENNNKVNLTAATTTIDLMLIDIDLSDVPYKGHWQQNNPPSSPSLIDLNRYFLDGQTFSEIQNTITHELGHALGLDHSFTGNVMNFTQSPQTSPGPQDIVDLEYLWP